MDPCDPLKKKKKKLPSPLKKMNYFALFNKKPKYKKYNKARRSTLSNKHCHTKKEMFEMKKSDKKRSNVNKKLQMTKKTNWFP